MSPLPVAPRPLEGETISSWWGAACYYGLSGDEICAALGLPGPNWGRWPFFRLSILIRSQTSSRAGRCADSSPEAIGALALVREGRSLGLYLWSDGLTGLPKQYCPECLHAKTPKRIAITITGGPGREWKRSAVSGIRVLSNPLPQLRGWPEACSPRRRCSAGLPAMRDRRRRARNPTASEILAQHKRQKSHLQKDRHGQPWGNGNRALRPSIVGFETGISLPPSVYFSPAPWTIL